MHWRTQRDLGELSAAEWFASKGARICFPVGHSPDWDFIAELDGRVIRLQVKTCISFQNRRWNVTVCTRGGNQSWSGIVKRFDPESCDYLFAVVGDGRRWCIRSDALQGKTSIALGGPRYAEFEVERGHPRPGRIDDEAVSTIAP
ncbi:MAG: group I intron-associated PD-(D/E)XK endonuclease [Thermoleophilaceae bacterium]